MPGPVEKLSPRAGRVTGGYGAFMPDTAVPTGSADWPLVGRGGVVAEVAAAVAAGRGVVLAGPAGVGKTRVLDTVLDRLPAPAWRCVATEATGRVPFGALAQLLPPGDFGAGRPAALFRATHRAVTADGTRTAVLAVDDAHLLDPAGLALVHHLTRAGGVVPLLSVRDAPAGGPPGAGPAGVLDLHRAEGLAWTELTPLGRDAVAELLALVLGGPVEGGTCLRLADLAGGDLVLLREVVAAAAAAGRLTRAGGLWRLAGEPVLTRRLDLLVAARMGRLPAAVLAAAQAVAVVEPTEPALLADRADPAALAGAEAAGLVAVRTEAGRTVVRCAHPLYAEVLRRGVPELARIETWTAVTGALLRRPDRSPDDELTIACWWLEHGRSPDAALLRRAAGRAAELLDHDLARRLALAAAGDRPDAGALRLAAEESLWLGDLARADELLDRSLAAAADPAERESIVAAVAGRQLFGAGRITVALDLLDRLPPTPLTVGLRVAAELNRSEVAAADRLLAAYERGGGDVVARAVLLAARTMVDHNAGRPVRAVRRIRRLRESVRGDDRAVVDHVLDSAYRSVLLLAGEGDRAEPLAAAAYEAAVRQGVPEARARAATQLARFRRERGDAAGALALWREAVGLIERAPSALGPSQLAHALDGLVDAHVEAGDLAGARAALARLAATPLGEVDVVSARLAPAAVAAATGDLAGALGTVAATAAWTRARGAGLAELQTLTLWVELAAARSARAAVPLPGWLLPRVRELGLGRDAGPRLARLVEVVEALAGGHPDRLLAAAAAVEADGQLLRATELAATAGRRAGRAADRLRAAELVARLRGQGVAATTPLLRAAGAAGPLTPREHQVAVLAADGLSNRDIAGRLGVSARTVENHLYRACGKLGVRGRAELRGALRPAGQAFTPLHSRL
jgi:DNA-binding CsgD family transcriptional regulator